MKFEKPVKIGMPIIDSTIVFDGTVGIEYGRNVFYTTTKGITPTFYVIDLEDRKVMYSRLLEKGGDVWSHTVTPNGNVYIASGNQLWKYSPKDKTTKKVYENNKEIVFWALTHDEIGNIYIGTFPGGKVLQYNPLLSCVRDFGSMNEHVKQDYVRSIVYCHGYLYAGTSTAELYRINLKSGKKENIAVSLHEEGFVYDLNIVDKTFLIARFSTTERRYIYHVKRKKWLDLVIENSIKGYSIPNESINGSIYIPANGVIMTFDVITEELKATKWKDNTKYRTADIIQMDDPALPGKSILKMDFSGNIHLFNYAKGVKRSYQNILPSSPAITHRIGKGFNGDIYITAMQASKAAVYDMKSKKFHTFKMGQAGCIMPYQQKVFFGVYPGAKVFEYDSEQPENEMNPRFLFSAGESQDRLLYGTIGNDKLYLPSMPDYGQLGGAMIVFNPQIKDIKQSFTTYRNIVKNQSVISVTYHAGKIFGATSIFGGIGAEPTESEAKIFVWDTLTNEKLTDFTLEIPGLKNPKAIGGLVIGPKNLLWGAVNGIVFALHEKTLKLVKYKNIFSEDKDWAEWGSANAQLANGLIYMNLGRRLIVLNPETMEHVYLADSDAFIVAEDGAVYFSPHDTNDFQEANRTNIFSIKKQVNKD